jgi:AcrR family transcriptional regulator
MKTPYGKTSDVIWERSEPRPRAAAALTREAIVVASIKLADADGLDAVSIRTVAAALGAAPMRLYGYFATKDELLDLMVDAVYGEVEIAAEPAGEDAHELLRRIARATRQAALRHEWFVDLLGGRPHLGPHALAVLEASAAGFALILDPADVGDLWPALGVLNGWLIGAARREISERRALRLSGLDESAWQASVGPYMARMFATGSLPTLERLVRDGAQLDPELSFERELGFVLAGILAQRDS